MIVVPPKFQNRIFVSVTEAAEMLGLKPKIFYNQISAGCCPIPTMKLGGRSMARVANLRRLTGSDYPLRMLKLGRR
jgi:predicted DNA-binding transcriptional regulator AlpA